MKTTKNKAVKRIKNLANGLLYCALLVSTGWKCPGSKKEFPTIRLVPKAEKLITEDENNDLLAQPNLSLEESSTIPAQPLNIVETGLEGNNETNQRAAPVEDGPPNNKGNLQSDQEVNNQVPIQEVNNQVRIQEVNNQVPIPPGAPNENRDNGNLKNVQGEAKRLNEQPADLKYAMPQSGNTAEQNIPPDQNPLPLLLDFKEKINAQKEEKEQLKQELSNLCKKNKYSKLLKKVDTFFSQNDFNSIDFLSTLQRNSEQDQANYKTTTLEKADKYIKNLKTVIEKNKNKNKYKT